MEWLADFVCKEADQKFSGADDQSRRLSMLITATESEMDQVGLAKAIYSRGYNAQVEREPENSAFMRTDKTPIWKVRLSKRSNISPD